MWQLIDQLCLRDRAIGQWILRIRLSHRYDLSIECSGSLRHCFADVSKACDQPLTAGQLGKALHLPGLAMLLGLTLLHPLCVEKCIAQYVLGNRQRLRATFTDANAML